VPGRQDEDDLSGGYGRRARTQEYPGLQLKPTESYVVNPPSVSVVIPLFNKGPYIARTIGSVLAQTLGDFEIIVVNDGSTDDGPQVVRRMSDPRIRLIEQTNAGVSAARNHGIREARADLVAFLDADDEWMPGFLAAIMNLQADYPEAGAYVTAHRIAKGPGVYRDVVAPGYNRGGRTRLMTDYFGSAHRMWIHTSSIVVRRRVFDRVGGFREGCAMGEDVDMWFRIAAYYDIAYCPRVASVWRYDVETSACKTRLPPEWSALSESMKAIAAATDVPVGVKKRARLFWTRMAMRDARTFCLAGRKDVARRLLQETGYSVSPLSAAHTVLVMALPMPVLRSWAQQRVRLVRAILRGRQFIWPVGTRVCGNER
jgi:cellulose synthase/poly-beta-1,6-N-acetylglucosamine synthase-like glycosyltransferase